MVSLVIHYGRAHTSSESMNGGGEPAALPAGDSLAWPAGGGEPEALGDAARCAPEGPPAGWAPELDGKRNVGAGEPAPPQHGGRTDRSISSCGGSGAAAADSTALPAFRVGNRRSRGRTLRSRAGRAARAPQTAARRSPRLAAPQCGGRLRRVRQQPRAPAGAASSGAGGRPPAASLACGVQRAGYVRGDMCAGGLGRAGKSGAGWGLGVCG